MTPSPICRATPTTQVHGADLDPVAGPNHAETSCAYKCYTGEPQGCAGSFASDDDFPLATDEVHISRYCAAGSTQIASIALSFNSECDVPLFSKGTVTLERGENGTWTMKARQNTNDINHEDGLPWTFCKPDHVMNTVIAALQCFDAQDANHELATSIAELQAQAGTIAASSPHYKTEADCAQQRLPGDGVMPMRD